MPMAIAVPVFAIEHSDVQRSANLHLCEIPELTKGRSKVLDSLVMRWRMRNFLLVCPSCKNATPTNRGRYMLGEERLTCDRCGATDSVTFWRFEGIAHRACASSHGTAKVRAH